MQHPEHHQHIQSLHEKTFPDWICWTLIIIGSFYILESFFSGMFQFMRYFPWYAVAAILFGVYGLQKK